MHQKQVKLVQIVLVQLILLDPQKETPRVLKEKIKTSFHASVAIVQDQKGAHEHRVLTDPLQTAAASCR